MQVLTAMYSPQTLLTLNVPQLFELAHVFHCCSMTELLRRTDKVTTPYLHASHEDVWLRPADVQALAVRCCPGEAQARASAETVLSYLRKARRLGLEECEAKCILFIAEHAKDVARADPDDLLSAVLAGAITGRFQRLTKDRMSSAFQEARRCLAGQYLHRSALNHLEMVLRGFFD